MRKILLSALILGMISFMGFDLKAQSNNGNANSNIFYVSCSVDGERVFLEQTPRSEMTRYIQYCHGQLGGTPRVYTYTSLRKAQEVLARKYLLELEKQRREEEREDRKNGN